MTKYWIMYHSKTPTAGSAFLSSVSSRYCSLFRVFSYLKCSAESSARKNITKHVERSFPSRKGCCCCRRVSFNFSRTDFRAALQLTEHLEGAIDTVVHVFISFASSASRQVFEESSASILDHYSGGSEFKIAIIHSLIMVSSITKFCFVIFETRTATGREHFSC